MAFSGLEARPWSVDIEAEGVGTATRRVSLTAGERHSVDVVLGAGSQISGIIVDKCIFCIYVGSGL